MVEPKLSHFFSIPPKKKPVQDEGEIAPDLAPEKAFRADPVLDPGSYAAEIIESVPEIKDSEVQIYDRGESEIFKDGKLSKFKLPPLEIGSMIPAHYYYKNDALIRKCRDCGTYQRGILIINWYGKSGYDISICAKCGSAATHFVWEAPPGVEVYSLG